MIFDLTKDYVPQSYVESRDYRVFLRLLGILTTVMKYNIDHFPDLYDADNCPDHLLPLLASMVGYKYKEEKSITSNRKIIKYFPYLIRNRGSEIGMKLAVALSINTDPKADRSYSIDNIIIEPDPATGLITIYYPRVDVIDWDLIEVVRPVGTRIKLIKADIGRSTEELDLKVTASYTRRSDYFDESVVDRSQVGYDVNKVIRDKYDQEGEDE